MIRFRLLSRFLATALFFLGTSALMAQENEGFVQLFNGKDLTGWKTHPADKAKWEVKDGLIVGTGPAGHLFTERDDFEDFIFRLTVTINDKGNSGQYFRTKFKKAFPVSGVDGYEAQLNSTHTDTIKTGSLYNFVKISDILVQPDTEFVQEVTAIGNHIVIKVNGKTTVDLKIEDPKKLFTKGHLAIQQHDPGSVVKVRKVEVKELKK